MNRAQIRAILETMTAWEQEPTLTEQEIESLLDLHQRADSSGILPAAVTWTPTFDLTGAAAEGWRWKAGKCVERFDFSSDVSSFSRSQMHKHCLAMVNIYEAGGAGTILVGLPSYPDPVIANLNGGT